METINAYNGNDGYQEIIMVEETPQGQETFKIQILAHHFDTILSLLPIDNYDQNSVMYNYI